MTGDDAGRAFPRELLAGDTLAAARALLGARLVHDVAPGRREGRIVEVEAYSGEDDRASHARFGRTARNAVMYGPPGVAYVYLVYGMYHCLNVVTARAGRPAAVLVRAVEPLAGLDAMRAAAHPARPASRAMPPREPPDARLAAGPGLVGRAFGLDRSHTGIDLLDPASPLRLERPPAAEPAPVIVATPRIGIAYAGEPWTSVPWRFYVEGSPSVSGRRVR